MKILAFLFWLLPVLAVAQDSLLQIKTLSGDDFKEILDKKDSKIVSASRMGKKVEELPFTIYIITKEEIKKNGYITLTDALKMVPGIRISKPGSGTRGETFLMRGLLGNEYAKILLDDVPIQTSVTGSFNIGENLPIAQAERIEVIYGPNSSLYGADAMVGVINIVTQTTQESNYANAQMIAGTEGYRHIDFMMGGRVGKDQKVWQYNFYANYGKRDNWNLSNHSSVWDTRNNFADFFDVSQELRDVVYTNPDLVQSVITQNMPHFQGTLSNPVINDMPHESYVIGGNINFKNFYVGFNEAYRKDHSSIGRTPLVFGYANPSTYIAETLRRTNVGYSRNFERFSIIANASYLRFRFDNQSSFATNYGNGGRSYVYSASDDFFGEILSSFRISPQFEMTAGLSGTYSFCLPQTNEMSAPFDEADYRPFTNYRKKPDALLGNFGYHPQAISNIGFFVQGYYSIKKFAFILGARMDNPSNYDGQIDERIYTRAAGIYRFSDRFSLRLMAGYAFKAPSPDALYASLAFKDAETDSILYQIVPNFALKPERYSSLEAGLRYIISHKWDLDINLSFNYIAQRLTRFQRPINIRQYPLSKRSLRGRPSLVRIFDNDENSNTGLISLQSTLRGKNIVPSIHLNSDIYLNLSKGSEILPNDLGTIEDMRQVPRWLVQWRISMQPTKQLYINIEQLGLGSWMRGFIPTPQRTPRPTIIKGYYNLDISASYKLGKNANIIGKIINVFDTAYGGIDASGLDVDLLYNPQIGRTYQIGLNFNAF